MMKSGHKKGKNYNYEVVVINSTGKTWANDYWGTTKKEVVKKMLRHELKGEGWTNYYPYVFITTFRAIPVRKEKIVDAPELFSAFKGKTVEEVMEFISGAQTYLSHKIDDPLQVVKEYEKKYIKKH